MTFARPTALGFAGALAAGPVFARTVEVADVNALRTAIAGARAGDEIVLAPGTYRASRFSCTAAGTAAQPIVVRAARRHAARIELDGLEGFLVSGPFWRFQDLEIRGVCADDSACEHAFHVVGKAQGFVLRGNRVFDFNAHLKVNSMTGTVGRDIPHDGLVERNELGNTRPRNTTNPVVPLNIDNASRWTVRGNFIHDHHKAGGDRISYGAFVKGGAVGALFEQNLVICNFAVAGAGTTIGLSFGGGGMAPALCAPAFDANVPCDPEAADGVMRNNVVAGCSDVGVYLNRSRNTRLLHNTLIGTTGIDFRFPSSTGEAHGNVLAGRIRVRDGAVFSGADNLTDLTAADFTAMYVEPLRGDLRRKGGLAPLLGKGAAPLVSDDYCGRARGAAPTDWGALEHSLGDCETTRPHERAGAPAPVDAGVRADAAPRTDGGAPADAAVFPPDGPAAIGREQEPGCSCRVGGRPASASPLLVALAALLLRRRRSADQRRRHHLASADLGVDDLRG